MAFNDLREFIKKLEETGDVVNIRKEVHWNLEAGVFARPRAGRDDLSYNCFDV